MIVSRMCLLLRRVVGSIPLQNIELGRRNLSLGRLIELKDSQRGRYQHDAPRKDVKHQRKQLTVVGKEL